MLHEFWQIAPDSLLFTVTLIEGNPEILTRGGLNVNRFQLLE
jgi:hypothetical protein